MVLHAPALLARAALAVRLQRRDDRFQHLGCAAASLQAQPGAGREGEGGGRRACSTGCARQCCLGGRPAARARPFRRQRRGHPAGPWALRSSCRAPAPPTPRLTRSIPSSAGSPLGSTVHTASLPHTTPRSLAPISAPQSQVGLLSTLDSGCSAGKRMSGEGVLGGRGEQAVYTQASVCVCVRVFGGDGGRRAKLTLKGRRSPRRACARPVASRCMCIVLWRQVGGQRQARRSPLAPPGIGRRQLVVSVLWLAAAPSSVARSVGRGLLPPLWGDPSSCRKPRCHQLLHREAQQMCRRSVVAAWQPPLAAGSGRAVARQRRQSGRAGAKIVR